MKAVLTDFFVANVISQTKFLISPNVLPIVFLGVQSLLIILISINQSATYDETGHLVAGLAHWKHSDFSLYTVNAPLP